MLRNINQVFRRRLQLSLHHSVRAFSVSSAHYSDDGDSKLKNDPDIKKFLSTIQEDFKSTDKTKEPESNETGTPKSSKNVSDLLSELYGDADLTSQSPSNDKQEKSKFSSVGGYVEYSDTDNRIIYDVDEERAMLRKAYLEGKEVPSDKRKKSSPAEKYPHLSRLKDRGERGVFELSEVMELLESEKIADIAVMEISPERQYADHMVVGTANSERHLRLVSRLLISVYKRKMWEWDPVPRVEGGQDATSGWNAIDLGNIVLHLLTQEQREYYDLETLWTVGPEFDDATRNLEAEASAEVAKLNTLEDLMRTELDITQINSERFAEVEKQ